MKKEEKSLVLKIVTSTWKNASRDMRELSVVRELGADVIVMAKGDETGIWENVNDFQVYRISTRPCGKWVPNVINRLVSVFIWAGIARRFNADILSCHDLEALYIGWLSTWFMSPKRRPRLIYDSHEFTIYAGNKKEINRFFIKLLEGFIIKKCSFVLEVNDQIADEVQQIHKLEQRPIVVRNVPSRWDVDSNICASMRQDIMKKFNVKYDKEEIFLLMYHGSVVPERGIEALLEVLKRNPYLGLVILGDGAKAYIEKLKEFCRKEKIDNRVLFHDAVSHDELWKYVGAADVGMIMVRAAWKSYYYMLPNKFFECIQAEIPVICSNFPVIEPLVKKYQIGLTCNPDSYDDINLCVEKMRLNKDLKEQYKNNVRVVKEELVWEKERNILVEAYKSVLT